MRPLIKEFRRPDKCLNLILIMVKTMLRRLSSSSSIASMEIVLKKTSDSNGAQLAGTFQKTMLPHSAGARWIVLAGFL